MFNPDLTKEQSFIKKNLILNPTENFLYKLMDKETSFLNGLYVFEDIQKKDETKILEERILFPGRETQQKNIVQIEDLWKQLLNADNISLKLLSGLHAHTVVFMGIGNIGDTVMLLPEKAGGHSAAHKILDRLGYNIIDMAIDYRNYCIDMKETLKIIESYNPQFIFVDRSDGLYYEDFSPLLQNENICGIFDASQYLTQIISGCYCSPFKMGFKIILSSLHKNFPGPQKALVCDSNSGEYWEKVKNGLDSYISSSHVEAVYQLGLILNYVEELNNYSFRIIENTKSLEIELSKYDIPVVRRDFSIPISSQTWIAIGDKQKAYSFYKKLEQCGLLVNYRHLAYELGYGIRIGTPAATLCGLRVEHVEKLAYYLSVVYNNDVTPKLEKEIAYIIAEIIDGSSELI